MKDPNDQIGCKAIVDSLKKCWQAADQEIFLAAVILNPFYQCGPLGTIAEFNNASLGALIRHVYQRIFRTEAVPKILLMQCRHYLNGTNISQNTLQAELALEVRNASCEVYF